MTAVCPATPSAAAMQVAHVRSLVARSYAARVPAANATSQPLHVPAYRNLISLGIGEVDVPMASPDVLTHALSWCLVGTSIDLVIAAASRAGAFGFGGDS